MALSDTTLGTPGVVGVALYIEARRKQFTIQHLLIPPMVYVSGESMVDAQILFRQISATKPKRQWAYMPIPLPAVAYSKTSHALTYQGEDAVMPLMSKLQALLTQINSGDWKLYKDPLTVGITRADAAKIRLQESPAALLRRLNSARLEAGFDSSLWDVSATVSAGTGKKGF